MGNFILASDFIAYTPVASTSLTGYGATYLSDYSHPTRYWRNASTVNSTIMLKFVSLTRSRGIFIADGNCTDFKLNYATSTSFAAATTSTHNLDYDSRVQRYKGFFPVSSSNPWKAIKIIMPTQQPYDGSTYFRIGTLAILTTVGATALTYDPTYPYEFSINWKTATIDMESGAFEDAILNERGQFECSFGWTADYKSNEGQALNINATKPYQNLVFYENKGDPTKAYMMRRRTPITISWEDGGYANGINRIQTISFKEVI